MDYLNLGVWDLRVTIDLFLGGVGVGAFLISVLLSFYGWEKHSLSIKLGAYIAPVAVGLGLLVLISKLGVPMKFITTLWNVNPQSVMSIGVFIQTGFVLLALYYAYLIYKGKEADSSMRIVQTVGAFLALAVGLYHGLFMSSLGRVLWSELTPGMFIASSFTSGAALVLLLRELMKNSGDSTNTMEDEHLPLGLDRFQVMFFIILLVQLTSIVLWQFYSGRVDLEQEVSFRIFMDNYGLVWSFIVLIGGTILPLVITLRSMVKKETDMPSSVAILMSLLILVGGFTMKHLMIIGGQIHIPAGFLF